MSLDIRLKLYIYTKTVTRVRVMLSPVFKNVEMKKKHV
jgi:hypothetical protein